MLIMQRKNAIKPPIATIRVMFSSNFGDVVTDEFVNIFNFPVIWDSGIVVLVESKE